MSESRSILVTGGAGYIGAHTVRALVARGDDVAVVDNLCRGHRENVARDRLHELDVADTDALSTLLRDSRCEAVIHFAAFSAVGESMLAPERYFANNVAGSLSVLTAMVRAGVKCVVVSSSAAVYGQPDSTPIQESAPIVPVNPYGESKAMVESLLRWFDKIHGVRSVSLRYFNAAGAASDGSMGEEHDPETHLIPLLLRAVITGEPATMFGDDHATPDGTCIRDYIHVEDLAAAHVAAAAYLLDGGRTECLNVGTGTGHSVREVIGAVEEVTGRPVPYIVGARRDGDPPNLVAACDKIRAILGWAPRHSELTAIVRDAWTFATRARPG